MALTSKSCYDSKKALESDNQTYVQRRSVQIVQFILKLSLACVEFTSVSTNKRLQGCVTVEYIWISLLLGHRATSATRPLK